MRSRIQRFIRVPLLLVLLLAPMVLTGVPAASAQDTSCITGVKATVLGKGAPAQAEGYALVTVRLVFGPGGEIGAHIHPGTLVVTIESGTMSFTLLSGDEMEITRGEGDPDTVALDQSIELEAGDGFVETGLVHGARNAGDGDLVVIVSGLVEASQPLTQCV